MKKIDRFTVIQFIFVILGATLGVIYLPVIWHALWENPSILLNNALVDSIIGAIVFYILSLFVVKRIMNAMSLVEMQLSQKNPFYILMGTLGMIIGLILATLISIVLFRTPYLITNLILPALLMITFGYLGFLLGTTKLNDWRKIFRVSLKRGGNALTNTSSRNSDKSIKILDTNILIDGRIYEVAKTGFIEGTLLVPKFVLYELQYIADSADSQKRIRGRRGLDILNKLQTEKIMPIEITDQDYDNIKEVDSKLIRLAKDFNGSIITNDYNLNKVIQFQKVNVLNINELANSLKPRFVPGEHLEVMILKKGTERSQGVAFLDDGTMVVVEDGKNHLNERLSVEVTSSIQTDAGKMIFARIDDK
ncbi:putative PIN and TRAM-domain containing protein YacL [Apilactobacillus kunkeei]|uniref:PIN/TRAM domain-containing protein n=1 Tax=Apilactobacillus kunkeei TaxID=148814 RepID=UPI00200B8167|nr:PIN domain-containing protein [Apilactobacillus kunkeei]MCK8628947.1 PIN domain nuclease [Apilactobacillus kunkeei]CAI2569695.1 putative PIN and TRAM-domain containing protein YacL [Apilactobacillus kunkeei]CAI2570221.1 putative PIN and TRAM-domain containing protein YacL [Apilactobacillus kunkeei]CAI2570971.1 putative PIN and TRAM-domain containing protein YacL [Apilactobacillus kunkeei]CAI2570982.1 putative PIN and TRAM-domain containing protein YacL [Apilactobacillus kunkeei]